MGGVKDMLFDSPERDIENLPPEAHAELEGHPFEVNDQWLKDCDDEDDIRTAINGWWYSRYCDPAQSTPYAGREGGYLFIHGGPFDPSDLLHDRFGDLVEHELIEDIVGDLIAEVGDQWAPVHGVGEDWYDEEFGVIVDRQTPVMARLTDRLASLRSVLALKGDPAAEQLVRNMVYASAFSAFETYLWETMVFWVDNDSTVVRNILTKHAKLKDATVKWQDVFAKVESAKDDIKGMLQRTVWHRWDEVRPWLISGLDIKVPEFTGFREALLARHDIVHRSGMALDGTPVNITLERIDELFEKIEAYARSLEELLDGRDTDADRFPDM